jgi:hypothetical protein
MSCLSCVLWAGPFVCVNKIKSDGRRFFSRIHVYRMMGNANYEAYKSWKCENFSCLSFDDVSRAKVLEANKNMRGHLQIVAVVSRCSIHRSIWTFPSSQLMLFGICTGFQCLRLPCYLAFPSSRKPDSMPPPSNAAGMEFFAYSSAYLVFCSSDMLVLWLSDCYLCLLLIEWLLLATT